MYYSDCEDFESDYDSDNESIIDTFDNSEYFDNTFFLFKDIKDRFWYINYTLLDLMDFLYNPFVFAKLKYNNKVIDYYNNEINITFNLVKSYNNDVSLDMYKNFFYKFHKNNTLRI